MPVKEYIRVLARMTRQSRPAHICGVEMLLGAVER
jgi:hypothetical protein